MAETFGEADVILRVRLDELEKDLAASERMILDSNQRVANAQIQAQQEITRAKSQDDGSLVGTAFTALGAWRLLKLGVAAVGTGLAAIPGLATAAGAAMVAATAVATGAILGLVGLLGEAGLRARDFGAEVGQAIRELDGTTEKARDLAETLARIPVIGGLISSTFKGMSGDATLVQESWAELVSTIEDGQVKVSLLGRAFNGLMNISTTGMLLNAFGFNIDIVGDIDKMNKAMMETNRLLEQRNRLASGMAPITAGVQDASRNASRDAELAGLSGVDRVEVENRHRAEDQRRFFEERLQAIRQVQNAELANIDKIAQAEELSSAQVRAMKQALSNDIANQTTALALAQKQADADLEAAAKRRIELAKQEAAEQQKIIEQRNAAAMARLVTGTQVMSLQATGQDFEAQRAQAEADRQAAILQAQQDGQQNMIDSINAFYDARGKLIDQREREQRERDEKSANERATAMLQANERLRSSLLQMRLEMNGQSLEAQQEAIRQRFQEQIDQMEAQGNQIGADLARKLRDAELDKAEDDAAQKNEQTNADLQAQIRQQALRNAGQQQEAEAQRIIAEAEQRIKQMEAAGNEEGANLARKLRDLELESIGKRDAGEGRQVVLSRFSPGMADNESTNLQKTTVEVLREIAANTKNGAPALAG